MCVCVILLKCTLFQKICQLRAFTTEIEAGSTEWTGGGIHAVWTICVRTEPLFLAVISRVARPLPNLCNIMYREILCQGKTLLVVGTYVRRLLFKIIFALFGSRVRCVLHWCRMTWERACGSVITKERDGHPLTNLLHNNKDMVKLLKKVYCIISDTWLVGKACVCLQNCF